MDQIYALKNNFFLKWLCSLFRMHKQEENIKQKQLVVVKQTDEFNRYIVLI